MQAMAGKRPVPCPVAGRLGFWVWLSLFYLLRAAWLLCRRFVPLHPGNGLRAGNEIQLLCFFVPQRTADVRPGLCGRVARAVAAFSVVGARGGNGVRVDSLSPDGR